MFERAELRRRLVELALRAAFEKSGGQQMRAAFQFALKAIAAKAQADRKYVVAYEARLLRVEAAVQPSVCAWAKELGCTIPKLPNANEPAQTPV